MNWKNAAQGFIAMLMVGIGTGVIAADKMAAGSATGSISIDGKVTPLTHAAAFVDQVDKRKPTILILSDKPVDVSRWTSGMDFNEVKGKIIGIAFWFEGKGDVFRCEYYGAGPLPIGTGGVFDLKLDSPAGKDLTGSAVSTPDAGKGIHPVKLNVAFHATR